MKTKKELSVPVVGGLYRRPLELHMGEYALVVSVKKHSAGYTIKILMGEQVSEVVCSHLDYWWRNFPTRVL